MQPQAVWLDTVILAPNVSESMSPLMLGIPRQGGLWAASLSEAPN